MVDSFFNSLPDYLELLMGYIPILIVIAVPVAVIIAYRKTKIETQQAKETAELLGLTYINVAEEMKQSKPKDSALLSILSGWSTWAMEGNYQNLPVRVELIVKSNQQRYIARSDQVAVSNPTRTSYSRGISYTIAFNSPLPFDVTIRKNIKMPFNLTPPSAADQIKLNEDLDLFISGTESNQIKEWLQFDQRKDTLKRLFQSFPSLMIDRKGLYFKDQHKKAGHDHLRNNLTLLSNAALTLQIS